MPIEFCIINAKKFYREVSEMEEIIEELAGSVAEGITDALNEGMTSKSMWTRYIVRALVLIVGLGVGAWMIYSGIGCMGQNPDKGKAFVFLGIVIAAVSIGFVMRSIYKGRKNRGEQ